MSSNEEDAMSNGYDPNAVRIKYDRNNSNGWPRLLLGTSTTFPDWTKTPEGWKNDFNAAVVFPLQSEGTLHDRLIEPLQAVADSAGIELWTPTLHSTILSGDAMQGNLKEATFEGARAEVFKTVKNDPEMLQICREFPKITARFEYLVMDGGNVTLNCLNIPPVVKEYRERITGVFNRFGIPPKPMDNIFHITAARMKSVPADITPEERMRFATNLILLTQAVALDPLELTVERLWFGRDIQMTLRTMLGD